MSRLSMWCLPLPSTGEESRRAVQAAINPKPEPEATAVRSTTQPPPPPVQSPACALINSSVLVSGSSLPVMAPGGQVIVAGQALPVVAAATATATAPPQTFMGGMTVLNVGGQSVMVQSQMPLSSTASSATASTTMLPAHSMTAASGHVTKTYGEVTPALPSTMMTSSSSQSETRNSRRGSGSSAGSRSQSPPEKRHRSHHHKHHTGSSPKSSHRSHSSGKTSAESSSHHRHTSRSPTSHHRSSKSSEVRSSRPRSPLSSSGRSTTSSSSSRRRDTRSPDSREHSREHSRSRHQDSLHHSPSSSSHRSRSSHESPHSSHSRSSSRHADRHHRSHDRNSRDDSRSRSHRHDDSSTSQAVVEPVTPPSPPPSPPGSTADAALCQLQQINSLLAEARQSGASTSNGAEKVATASSSTGILSSPSLPADVGKATEEKKISTSSGRSNSLPVNGVSTDSGSTPSPTLSAVAHQRLTSVDRNSPAMSQSSGYGSGETPSNVDSTPLPPPPPPPGNPPGLPQVQIDDISPPSSPIRVPDSSLPPLPQSAPTSPLPPPPPPFAGGANNTVADMEMSSSDEESDPSRRVSPKAPLLPAPAAAASVPPAIPGLPQMPFMPPLPPGMPVPPGGFPRLPFPFPGAMVPPPPGVVAPPASKSSTQVSVSTSAPGVSKPGRPVTSAVKPNTGAIKPSSGAIKPGTGAVKPRSGSVKPSSQVVKTGKTPTTAKCLDPVASATPLISTLSKTLPTRVPDVSPSDMNKLLITSGALVKYIDCVNQEQKALSEFQRSVQKKEHSSSSSSSSSVSSSSSSSSASVAKAQEARLREILRQGDLLHKEQQAILDSLKESLRQKTSNEPVDERRLAKRRSELVCDKVQTLLESELKEVVKKDVRRKLIEGTAFRMLTDWLAKKKSQAAQAMLGRVRIEFWACLLRLCNVFSFVCPLMIELLSDE